MFIIPPNEYNSIFVMTNYIETDQRQGKCDEVRKLYKLLLIYQLVKNKINFVAS